MEQINVFKKVNFVCEGASIDFRKDEIKNCVCFATALMVQKNKIIQTVIFIWNGCKVYAI